MDLLNNTYQLRDCSDNTFRHRSRPCILYQMGKCSGPCVGKVSQGEYRESIDQVVGILEGKPEKIVDELRKGMEDAAEHEDYEVAAQYRDQIRNLELVTQTQGAVEAGSQRDRDVVGLARKDAESHGTMIRIRGGRMISVQHYRLQNTDAAVSDADLLFDFLSQYYVENDKEGASPGIARPKEVLLPAAPSDCELLESVLGIGIRVADGSVDDQLLNVAKTNAQYALEQTLKRPAGHGIQALEEIMDKLHLPRLPHRIECFDISNTQGEDSVASRVVFVDGAPDKNLYRRYKIKTVEGSNDFASMKEVLGRRFSHDESMPDLVVVDGGKGQLSQAVAIMEELGVQGVSVVGLAKARTERDFQATEVKSTNERVFIPNRKNPVPLLPHMPAYKLLVHVRDEAHRFAITYHRQVRHKRSLASDS